MNFSVSSMISLSRDDGDSLFSDTTSSFCTELISISYTCLDCLSNDYIMLRSYLFELVIFRLNSMKSHCSLHCCYHYGQNQKEFIIQHIISGLITYLLYVFYVLIIMLHYFKQTIKQTSKRSKGKAKWTYLQRFCNFTKKKSGNIKRKN